MAKVCEQRKPNPGRPREHLGHLVILKKKTLPLRHLCRWRVIVRSNDTTSARVWTIFKLMKFLSLLFGTMLLPALAARATDDMQIYSDRLNKSN